MIFHSISFTVLSLLVITAGGPNPLETDSSSANRWGRDGHKIVCEIAYEEVNTHTHGTINALIAENESYNSFPKSCLWADVVRRESQYRKFRTAHYINIPRGASRVSAENDCITTYCVLEAIEEMSRIETNSHSTRQERLEALKFLSHFIGDLHQPLHAGYADDRGGNTSRVTIWGESKNLHAIWDYGLIEHSGFSWTEYADQLEGEITQRDRDKWSGGSPTAWANESFRLVERSVYDFGAKENVNDPHTVRGTGRTQRGSPGRTQRGSPGRLSEPRIGDAYYQKNIGIVEEQLKKAGVRLAEVLDRVLAE